MEAEAQRAEKKRPGFRFWFSCRLLQGLGLVLCAAILGRSLYLQVVDHAKWKEIQIGQVQSVVAIPVYRGKIMDRRGQDLALSIKSPCLFADGALIQDPKSTAAQLASIVGEPADKIEQKLRQNKRFIRLRRDLSIEEAQRAMALKLPGIGVTSEWRRYYPFRHIGGHVIGFVGVDGVGLEGVEKAYDGLLRHSMRSTTALRDGGRRKIWLRDAPPPLPQERYSLQLALDGYLQSVAEQALQKAVKKHHAAAGQAILMDPQTFEVMALAVWPGFDPNNYVMHQPAEWRNRAIADAFEPGSSFKTFLLAAVLDAKSARPQDRIFCENGRIQVAAHTIRDVHPYGWLTVAEVLKVSSNIGALKLADTLGSERFYRYLDQFGFGKKTGVDLPGEISGTLRPLTSWRPIDLAVMAFGQGVTVTGLQLTSAVAAIANGGVMKTPRVAKAVLDASGRVVKEFGQDQGRRVLSSATAAKLRELMQGVVEPGGTGTKAALAQYTTAGKTGTAQVVEPETRRYSLDKYTSVFVGFAPVSHARLVMTVVIHEPQPEYYGGVVAAPVFRDVMEKALPYLGVLPDKKPRELPAAVRRVSTSSKRTTGEGVAMTSAEDGPVTVPNVQGLSLKAAVAVLKDFGLAVSPQGRGRVVRQHPMAGTSATKGTAVTIYLEEVL
ncbi:penicillin-binding protein [Desulfosoma caldarium]|uniref:Peptidoglycan synthetase FtsI n=1 Tax=Desulfosoma caldarium TaxID=610254 RepID=A0A3N1UU55_9BACT|nr:penicillin-binding protein [Desulfosoma caldarium]ROQ93248.1 peptidoglycan synthetase FtsI [Desulfosoma caldarium]